MFFPIPPQFLEAVPAFVEHLLDVRLAGFVLEHASHFDHGLAAAEELRGVVGVGAEEDQVVEGVFHLVGIAFGDAVVVEIEFQHRFETELERFPVLLQEIDVAGELHIAQHPHHEFGEQVHPVVVVVPGVIAHVAQGMALGHGAQVVRHAALGLEGVADLRHRHAFVFFRVLLEMLPSFDGRSVMVVKAQGGILGQNRIDETLAQIFFHAREEHQKHHRIPVHVRRIDIGVIETLQETGALLSLFVLDPDDGVGEREMEFIQDQPGQAQGAGPVTFVGGAGLDPIKDSFLNRHGPVPPLRIAVQGELRHVDRPAPRRSLKFLTYLRWNFVPSM